MRSADERGRAALRTARGGERTAVTTAAGGRTAVRTDRGRERTATRTKIEG